MVAFLPPLAIVFVVCGGFEFCGGSVEREKVFHEVMRDRENVRAINTQCDHRLKGAFSSLAFSSLNLLASL